MAAMTTREAARRLGVKVETLYAYVSRGLVERQIAADGRTSMFDSRAIEALAVRGRPRQSSRSTSLNMLIETRLTSLSPQGVRYRGLASDELAVTHTFEAVADLLWLGRSALTPAATSPLPWRGTVLPIGPSTSQPAAMRTARSQAQAAHGSMALGASLRVLAAQAASALPHDREFDAASVAAAGRLLIATLTDSLPPAGDGPVPRLTLPGSTLRKGSAPVVTADDVGSSISGRPIGGTIAGRLWTRLSPHRPPPGMLAVLNAALVLLADHELAASTLAVRVAASTRASPMAVVCTGLGVLSGPLHGGASIEARAMLERATVVGAGRAVGEILDSGRRIPGFGHRVYVEADPRAVVLLRLLRSVWGRTRLLTVVDDVHEVVRGRIEHEANVDFALAAMAMIGQMPADGGEVVMSIARIAGWLAHAIEEYGEAPLRFRPRASYIGD